jgi:hypothetical protein
MLDKGLQQKTVMEYFLYSQKEIMSNQSIQVEISTPHWLKRKVIYFPQELKSFFPADALGARGKDELDKYPAKGATVTFDYETIRSECDISTDKYGKMRARETGPIGKFFDANNAKVGDFVTITKVSTHHFDVRLVKTNVPAV